MQTPESMTTVNELKHRVDKLRTLYHGLRVIVYDEAEEGDVRRKYDRQLNVYLIDRAYL